MRISVIVPAYNAERFLADTLRSVQAQTWTDWEMVLVDDGSRDETTALAQRFADTDSRIRVVRQSNGGVAAARNRGFAEAAPESEGIIFLDHDDTWEPNALETLAGALTADPQAVAAQGLYRRIGLTADAAEEAPIRRDRRKWVNDCLIACSRTEPTTFAVLAGAGNNIATPGQVLIRWSALLSGGPPFDASVVPSDDWDLWLRLALRGDIAFVDKVVIDWRQHPDNASRDMALMHESAARVLRKLLDRADLTPEQRRIARYRFRRNYASVARQNAQDGFHDARKAVTRGRLPSALDSLARGVYHYLEYLRLRLLWSERWERRDIPLRARNAGRLHHG